MRRDYSFQKTEITQIKPLNACKISPNFTAKLLRNRQANKFNSNPQKRDAKNGKEPGLEARRMEGLFMQWSLSFSSDDNGTIAGNKAAPASFRLAGNFVRVQG